jgi:putative oxidoreductase
MAFGMAMIMIGAIAMVHLPHGFFMNWFGNQTGEGYEYHLLVIGLSLAIMVNGSGRLSIDRLFSKA